MALMRACSGVGVVTSVIFILNLSGNADYIRSAELGLKYFCSEVSVLRKHNGANDQSAGTNSGSKLFHTNI